MPDFVQIRWNTGLIRAGRAALPTHAGHEAFRHWCGRLICRVYVITPLTIFGNWRSGGRVYLPGTSLKGMVRAVAEALTHSCWPLPTAPGYVPGEAHHCQSHQHLCPCCRLFGGQFGQQENAAYQGRVSLSDARTVSPQRLSFGQVTLHGHRPSRIGGRTLYGHQDPSSSPGRRDSHRGQWEGGRGWTNLGYVAPATRFTLSVDFWNLSEEELGDLLYFLELEDDMAHKLGYRKVIGMGSVKIVVTEVDATDSPAEAYRTFDRPAPTTDPAAVSAWVQQHKSRADQRFDRTALERTRQALRVQDDLLERVNEALREAGRAVPEAANPAGEE